MDELQPFIDDRILFLGNAIRGQNKNTFNNGVQFHTETAGRRIFIEKMVLDTPDLNTELLINEFIAIDLYHEATKTYYKRFSPFEDISEDSIPVTADYFMLRVDYRLDNNPTKQMSIKFDNVSFLAPVL